MIPRYVRGLVTNRTRWPRSGRCGPSPVPVARRVGGRSSRRRRTADVRRPAPNRARTAPGACASRPAASWSVDGRSARTRSVQRPDVLRSSDSGRVFPNRPSELPRGNASRSSALRRSASRTSPGAAGAVVGERVHVRRQQRQHRAGADEQRQLVERRRHDVTPPPSTHAAPPRTKPPLAASNATARQKSIHAPAGRYDVACGRAGREHRAPPAGRGRTGTRRRDRPPRGSSG